MRIRMTGKAGMPVEVVPGLSMLSPLTMQVDDVNGFDVELTLVPQGGRIVAHAVKVMQREDGPPVTGEVIRTIPVAGLIQEAAPLLMATEHEPEGTRSGLPALTNDRIALLRAAGPTDETLRAVAHVYRSSRAVGGAPTKSVELTFEVSRPTAGRWVALARERGFLGPTEPGKAGETRK